MSKSAALLQNNKKRYYFKVQVRNDIALLRKLRTIKNCKRIGFYTFTVPFTSDVTEFLQDNKFTFNGAFIKLQKKHHESQNPIKKIPKYKKKGLKPRQYQMEGVNYIETHQGRVLIADVMRLGKTITALAWLQYRKDIKKTLIVCPSSVKINWQEETEKWITRKIKIEILQGKTTYKPKGNVIIINYDILHYWLPELCLTRFDACIADEIHYVKSEQSQRTKAFKEVTRTIPNIIGLTGTPIENDPIEIYYLVNLINKNIFPNYIKFITRYAGAKQEEQRVRGGKVRKIWKRKGFTKQKELHRILRENVMIRRTLEDVKIQLPDREYSDIHLSLDNWEVYSKAENDFIQYIKEKFDSKQLTDGEIKALTDDDTNLKKAKIEKLDAISRAPALVKLNELKILAAQGKVKQVISWIENFLKSGEKLIVFAINKSVVSALMEAFPDAVKIAGGVSPKKRNEAVKSFQNDPKVKLFVGNMKAAGVGLTLDAASSVAVIQFPWNPGELLQAEARPFNVGKTGKIIIYKFIGKDTIEERIIKLLKYKQDEIDKIIDGKNIKYKRDMVKLLIESYR